MTPKKDALPRMELVECLPKDSWFQKWMECWPLAESPRSYILFSGMAMLGAAIGRRSYFDLDVHRVFPLMNLLLIGPSGIGKSTALRDIALKSLIQNLPEADRPQVSIGKSTKEAMHEDLMANPHTIILASELSNLFSKEKYNEGMIPYITDLLDLEPVRIRTKGGGPLKSQNTIDEPECCILGGSTKAWLQDMLPNNAGEGGFLPRFFIVKEDYKYQRIADPRRHMSDRQRAELGKARERVFYEFSRLVGETEGLLDFFDYDASDEYSLWYQTFRPESGALAPFAARAGAHVLRIALLSAISCRRGFIIQEDVRAGIQLYEYASRKLQEVVIPMSSQGRLLNKVLECVGAEQLTIIQIRRAMRNYCGASDVDKMLRDLLSSGELVTQEGKYRRANAQ